MPLSLWMHFADTPLWFHLRVKSASRDLLPHPRGAGVSLFPGSSYNQAALLLKYVLINPVFMLN